MDFFECYQISHIKAVMLEKIVLYPLRFNLNFDRIIKTSYYNRIKL